jgi:hypothetical protein
MPSSTPDSLPEEKRLRWALALERISVGWNLLVGVATVIVGVFASSLALLSLGADAVAATVGAAVVAWRFYVERRDRPGHHGHKCPDWVTRLTGAFLLLFCLWVAVASISNLLGSGSIPAASTFGIVIAGMSFVSTIALTRAKLAFAAALASATLREEAWRTIASVWVSGITLLGLSANVALDWWWADPVAAFVLVPFLGTAGLQDLFGPLSPDITAHRQFRELRPVQRKRLYSLIEIWRCPYPARCRRWWCRSHATVVARHFDGLGQTLREVELCERHAGELAKSGIAVRDMR